MFIKRLSRVRITARRVTLVLQGIILTSASLVPFLVSQSASAASLQLSARSVSSSTAVPGAVTALVFTFTTTDKGSSTLVKQIELEFCDTPLGTCAVTKTPTLGGSPTVTMGGTWSGSTPVITRQATGRGGAANNQFNIVYGTAANENNKVGLTITLPVAGTDVTNFGTANKSYYPRIRLYSDTGTTEEWYGAVAQSTSQSLTVNARVQEVLSFCIGTTPTDSASIQIRNTGNTADVTGCAAADGTSVDLGNVTNSVINTTPVTSTNQGDGKLAYAMVQTNAQNGVVIGYRAVQNTSSGQLKVAGSTCSGTTTTDQCFNSQGATSGAFTSGTENFGMTVAGINCFNAGTNYGTTCAYATGNNNVCIKTNYFQTGYTCGTAGTYVTTADTNTATTKYAWVDTGSSITNIAGSDASTLKVVANEALMLKFAATAQITTPTGLYQAQADFVATPIY